MHLAEIHVTKSDTPEQVNHVLQEALSFVTLHHQVSSQGRDKGWLERQIICWFLQSDPIVDEFEVLQVCVLSERSDFR